MVGSVETLTDMLTMEVVYKVTCEADAHSATMTLSLGKRGLKGGGGGGGVIVFSRYIHTYQCNEAK